MERKSQQNGILPVVPDDLLKRINESFSDDKESADLLFSLNYRGGFKGMRNIQGLEVIWFN
jgi:hypothetical protein